MSEKIKISKARSCPHCAHCGVQLNLQSKAMDYVCRFKPGTAAAAFVPGPQGLEVKLVTAWPPVTANDWCAEFTPKLDA